MFNMKKETNKNEESIYMEKLLNSWKNISVELSKDKELEKKIKKLSSY